MNYIIHPAPTKRKEKKYFSSFLLKSSPKLISSRFLPLTSNLSKFTVLTRSCLYTGEYIFSILERDERLVCGKYFRRQEV